MMNLRGKFFDLVWKEYCLRGKNSYMAEMKRLGFTKDEMNNIEKDIEKFIPIFLQTSMLAKIAFKRRRENYKEFYIFYFLLQLGILDLWLWDFILRNYSAKWMSRPVQFLHILLNSDYFWRSLFCLVVLFFLDLILFLLSPYIG